MTRRFFWTSSMACSNICLRKVYQTLRFTWEQSMRLGRLMILVPLILLSVVCEGKPKLDATPPGAGAPEIKLVPVIRGTDHPVYLKSDGTDRLFVVEQPGRIRLVKDGTLAPKPYLDIRDQVFYQG